jgi:hypothetical protein
VRLVPRQERGAFSVWSEIAVGAALVLSLVAMRLAGLNPIIPTPLIYLVIVAFPFGFAVARVIRFLQDSRLPSRWRPFVGLLAGVGALALYWPDRAWFLLPAALVMMGMIVRCLAGPNDGTVQCGRIISALLMVGGIYVVVWNANYLVLLAGRFRLHDASMQALDQWLYSALLGRPIIYDGWFPLTHAPWLIVTLERGYAALFVEVAVALFLLVPHTRPLRVFVARLSVCYALGLVIFVLWPVAGPHLVYPTSISATFTGTSTSAILRSSLADFAAITHGGQPVSGFGYFVALPSLHVAMAVLLQFTIGQRSRVGGWVVAPMNALMVVSTFGLGYHYLVDVPAGMLLAWGSIRLWRGGADS